MDCHEHSSSVHEPLQEEEVAFDFEPSMNDEEVRNEAHWLTYFSNQAGSVQCI